VGLKSNRSFRDFLYYGKITKSKYCPTKNKIERAGLQREREKREREREIER